MNLKLEMVSSIVYLVLYPGMGGDVMIGNGPILAGLRTGQQVQGHGALLQPSPSPVSSDEMGHGGGEIQGQYRDTLHVTTNNMCSI